MALLRNSGKCKNDTLIILLNGPLVEEASFSTFAKKLLFKSNDNYKKIN